MKQMESFSKMKYIALSDLATNQDPVQPLQHYFVLHFSSPLFLTHLSFYAATKSCREENKEQKRSISAC